MSGEDLDRYASAGVSIERGNRWVDAIRPLAAGTHRNGVIAGIGGFGGVFRPEWAKYRDPVLVSGTDGVGTKLKVAQWAGIYEGLGVDLVAMCANDIAVMGAEPLFFLDYYASGRLDPEVGKQIFSGIAEGCRQAGAALLGGETAEMPGVYQDADFDLAGFVVGIADRENIVDGRTIGLGHRLYGLPSTGIHSNGFSLVRKVLLEEKGIAPEDRPDWSSGEDWAHILTRPTRIYVPPDPRDDLPGECERHGPCYGRGIDGECSESPAGRLFRPDKPPGLGETPGVSGNPAGGQGDDPGNVPGLQHGHRTGRSRPIGSRKRP